MALLIALVACFIGLVALYLAADVNKNLDIKMKEFVEAGLVSISRSLEDVKQANNKLSENARASERDLRLLLENKKEVEQKLTALEAQVQDLRMEVLNGNKQGNSNNT